MQGNKCKEQGFTLVELSIVLVIIGLIVAGVLVGQDLIKGARIRATVTQIQQFDAGIGAFRVKYDAIPGDILSTTANAYGLSNVGGDNDGQIEDDSNNVPITNYGGEAIYFFPHLSDAEMIPGDYDETETTAGFGFPESRLKKGGYIPTSIGMILYYFLGLTDTQTIDAAVAEGAILTPEEAFSIDNKLDDGVPNAGTVLAVTAINTVDTTTGTASCLNNSVSPNVYRLANGTISCQLQIRASGS
ncbi:MAG: prepilin-type N-terminal cleavage/methylation domain-containing protein [Hyphomicrobiales bacterium]|nr:prepilin-type N-terminal cleavage/methylation domain-containing protein [Hyphomicrobiales bacterium]